MSLSIQILFHALCMAGSILSFSKPLREFNRKRLYAYAGAVAVLSAILETVPDVYMHESFALALLMTVLDTALVSLAFLQCSHMDRFSSIYSGIWVMLIAAFIEELTHFLQYFIDRQGMLSTGSVSTWAFSLPSLVAGLLLCVAILYSFSITLAKLMPTDGTYQIGPRQFTSAVSLYIIFMFMELLLRTGNFFAKGYQSYIVIMILLQIYSVSLLYVQTELFKKSAMKKEMEAVQTLLYKRKEQYDLARQNIQLINRRCHDLKLLVDQLQRMNVNAETTALLAKVQEAAVIYDSVVKTGNDVLDTVITDKSLICQERGIHINCVADGQSLSFMEAVDIYSIFNSILDAAISMTSRVKEKERRTIDVMVYKKQSFLVINVMHAAFSAIRFQDGLPVPKDPEDMYMNYNLKAVREVLRRYDGIFNCEVKTVIFACRIVIPV